MLLTDNDQKKNFSDEPIITAIRDMTESTIMRQIFLVRSRLLQEQATLLSRQSQKQTFL